MFAVELQRAEPPAAAQEGMLPAPIHGRIAGLRVLCIDNEPDVLDGMRALLDGWGCTTVSARDAGGALERLRETGEQPDIILADFHLDTGTGLEAAEKLRATVGNHVPIIVITADHSMEVQREVRARGFSLLRKPLKAAALRALMHQLTWQRAAAAE
jgi:CheY-like chemotaxis protein